VDHRSDSEDLPSPAGAPADAADVDARFALIYGELKRLAHRIRSGRAGETLNTTALVHEAYVKLASSAALEVRDRSHFFAIAARAMRQILVDTARRRVAQKRGGEAAFVTFDEALFPRSVLPLELLALDEALARLETQDARVARVVEYRVFGGLSAEETATALGVSRPTIDRDWRAARAWLAVELDHDVA
jgi:RNA polymerase sigma factor (TIGR02999 family)